jgi:ATP-dependent exoDNAse (exonuclease V) beta subunit
MFNHLEPVQLPELKARNVDGKRFYETESGEAYPSITTVLSQRDKKGLMEWRKRVGEEVANHIGRKAANRGTAVHNMVEDYLNNVNEETLTEKHKKNFLPWCMFNEFKPILNNINNIHTQEAQLFSEKYTVAGRVDCIAEYEGELSVIDFKTASGEKKEDWITNYFIQGTAYAEMYEERTGIPINNIVILIVTEDGGTQVFKKDKHQYLVPLKESIEEFYKSIENEKNNL